MVNVWPKIWKDHRSAPSRSRTPDSWNPNPSYSLNGGGRFSGRAPTNNPGPFIKTVDSIPPGEINLPFTVPTGNLVPIFTSTESVQIEICEVFCQSIGGGTIQIFKNGNAQSGIVTLEDKWGFSDPGFTLAQGETVQLTVTGGGTVNGFIRWRYR